MFRTKLEGQLLTELETEIYRTLVTCSLWLEWTYLSRLYYVPIDNPLSTCLIGHLISNRIYLHCIICWFSWTKRLTFILIGRVTWSLFEHGPPKHCYSVLLQVDHIKQFSLETLRHLKLVREVRIFYFWD